MKNLLFMSLLAISLNSNAASMVTPEAQLTFKSADDQPIAGVALTGMLGFTVVTVEDCTGFICMPSLPHRVHRSESGDVLGKTNAEGVLKIPSLDWETNKLTAKDLAVTFFTNGTIDVVCPGKDSEEEVFAGFINLLPSEFNGQPYERNFECTSLKFEEDAEKEIVFNCKSPLTMAEIEEQVAAIKEEKCK